MSMLKYKMFVLLKKKFEALKSVNFGSFILFLLVWDFLVLKILLKQKVHDHINKDNYNFKNLICFFI